MATVGGVVIEISSNIARLVDGISRSNQQLGLLRQSAEKTNQSMKSGFESITKGWIGISAGIYTIQTALNVLEGAFAKTFGKVFASIENYQLSVASAAAVTMQFMAKKPGETLAESFKRASDYAEGMVPVLEQIAAKTLLSGEEAQMLFNEFAKGGVFLDAANEKAIEGFESFGNAIIILTKGQDRQRQILTEARAVMQGQAAAGSVLLKLLEAQDPLLKEHLNTWRAQNTTLENMSVLLSGFDAASGKIMMTWGTVKTAIQTTANVAMRQYMIGAYEEIIKKAWALNDWLEKHRDIIATGIYRAWESVKRIIGATWEVLKSIWEPLQLLLMFTGEVIKGWVYLTPIVKRIGLIFQSIGTELSGMVKLLLGDFKGALEDFAKAGDLAGKAFAGGIFGEIGQAIEDLNKELTMPKLSFEAPVAGETVKDFEKMSKSANEISQAISKMGLSQLELSSKKFNKSFEDTVMNINEIRDLYRHFEWEYLDADKKMADQTISLNAKKMDTVKASFDEYMDVIDNVYNHQIEMQKLLAGSRDLNAEGVAAQTAALYEIEKEYLNKRYEGWDKYYKWLIEQNNITTNEIIKSNQKILEFEKSIKDSKVTTEDYALKIRQKTMTESEKYYSTVENLEDKYYEAMKMTNEDKLKMLRELQGQWASLGDEVKEGSNIVISASEAQATAISIIEDIGREIENINRELIKSEKDKIYIYERQKASYVDMVATAQEAMGQIIQAVTVLEQKLAEKKVLAIDNSQALAAINEIKNRWNALVLQSKEAQVDFTGSGSSTLPISEKIDAIQSDLSNLSDAIKIDFDFSSMADIIKEYKILSTWLAVAMASRRAFGGRFVETGGQEFTIKKAMDMIEQSFTISMIQGLSNVLTQLTGHEKIDKLLQELIVRKLQNLSSFQYGTDYVPKTGIAWLHQGEQIIPSSKTTNNNISFAPTIYLNGSNINARQLDEELAYLWKYNRSKLKQEIKYAS